MIRMKKVVLLIFIISSVIFGQTWVQMGADIDGEAASDESGTSVAMSADGSRVAIGAYLNDGTGADAGHARVYCEDGNLALGVEDEQSLNGGIESFMVLPAYPNPFNPSTTIRYNIPVIAGETKQSDVQMQIFDITGKLITTLLNKEQTPGWHSITWNGTNQHGNQGPAGIYFSKISIGDEVKTAKLILLR